jgi:predicted kinase
MQCVLFIGLQASGKSTFFHEHFRRTHLRLNLDMLKTRHREKLLVRACLEAKQPFVIDNTNPTLADRQRYFPQALEAGFEVIGYYFQGKLQDCLERNKQRPADEFVPPVAIIGTQKRLVLPHYREGFSTLFAVKQLPEKRFLLEPWRDEVP